MSCRDSLHGNLEARKLVLDAISPGSQKFRALDAKTIFYKYRNLKLLIPKTKY
jgi:hypothetical protein